MFLRNYRRNIPLLISGEMIAFFSITSLWVIYLSQCGMSMMQIGLLESIFHGTSLVFEIPSGALADRFSYKDNLYVGRILGIVSALVMIFSSSFWLFALGMALNALSYNFDSGTGEAILFESLHAQGEKERFLKLNSLRSGLYEITLTLGTLVAGLFVHHGMQNTYWIKLGYFSFRFSC
jgi:MFS family permease